jgi:hypothetical protein
MRRRNVISLFTAAPFFSAFFRPALIHFRVKRIPRKT